MYEQPELGFSYDALEPHFDKETLEIHYNKHHAAYVKKFNAAVEGTDSDDKELFDLIKNIGNVPEDIRTAVRNNGGGALNHSFFWEVLCSASESGEPGEKVGEAINEAFGSYDEFEKQFSDAAATVFGSGWAWLVIGDNGLEIMKTANQENPISSGKNPILVLDVWEHAYYLKYRNLRPDYIKAFFNLINWEKVEENFLS
jgi:Fe-Mn family superoxide dismutase